MSWKTIKIKDIGDIITGNTPPKKDPDNYGGDYPFLKPTDMEIGQRYTWETAETYSQKAFEKYKKAYIPPLSTCVVTIGTLGEKISLTHDYCFTNQSINSVIPDQKRYDPFFVFYLLKNNLHKVKHANAGTSSGREHVNKTTFSNIPVDVPIDISTQRRIASILSAYDDLIENNLKRIRLLEEAAQNIYREWFVHFRFPGHEQAEFGEDGVPVGWEMKPFSEVVQINPRTSVNKDVNAPYVPMASLSETSMIIDNIEERIPKGGAKFVNGDTLFARITPCLENGKTGFVQFLNEGQVATGSTEFIVFRETKKVSRFFIYCTSREYSFRQNAIKSMSGSDGRQRVKPEAFERYYLAIPTPGIMDEFASVASPLFKQIQTLIEYNSRLKEARDILLPRLMNRTIEV